MKIQDSLLNKLGILVLSLGISGCGYLHDSSKDFSKTAVYNGFKVYAAIDGSGRRAALCDSTLVSKPQGFGVGVYLWDKSGDGGFYTINVDAELPQGHPLWQYANPDSLEKIYAIVKSQEQVKEQ